MLNRRMPNGTYWWCERGEKISPTLLRLYAMGYIGCNLQRPMLRYTVDFDKTTYAHRIDEVKVRYQGFKALGLLPWGFIYVIRPLIVGLIPHDTLMEIKLEDNGVDLRKYRRRHRRRRK